MLNNQLLFYLESDEKEQHYKQLEKKWDVECSKHYGNDKLLF